jgi:glycosyltransferase involved in cell wall biosynthesis
MSATYEQAKALVRAENFAEALTALKQLLAEKKSPEILNDAGVCAYLLGDFEAGLKLVSESAATAPGFSLARINKFYLEKALELKKSPALKYRQVNHDNLDPNAKKPKVSVIVRTYNRTELLAKALESVRAQRFTDFETIVVNDGGDPTAEQVSRQAGMKNLRYFCAPHGGPSAALNRGLEMARGDYIAFLDDDDLLYPNHLEVLMARMEKEGRPGLAYPQVKYKHYDAAGKLLAEEIHTEPDIDLQRCLRYDPIASMLVLVSRECFEKLGMFIESLVTTAHDWEMWIRIIKNYPFFYVPELSAEYMERDRPDRATRTGLFETFYYSNLMLYFHQAVPLFSFPKDPGNEKEYAAAVKELDRLLGKYPDLPKKLRLYGFYHSKTMYGYFFDRFKNWMSFGDFAAALDFLKIALRLRPFEPKLWLGYISFLTAEKKAGKNV